MKTSKESSHTILNGRQKTTAVVQPRTVERIRRPEQCTIHFLTQDELRQLFKAIRSKRDKAIFLVAYRGYVRDGCCWRMLGRSFLSVKSYNLALKIALRDRYEPIS
jgi:hypothetical protein